MKIRVKFNVSFNSLVGCGSPIQDRCIHVQSADWFSDCFNSNNIVSASHCCVSGSRITHLSSKGKY